MTADSPRARPAPTNTFGKYALVAGLGQVGADDGEDERRLDAFAKAGQQAAGERAEVHRGRDSIDPGQGRMTLVMQGRLSRGI